MGLIQGPSGSIIRCDRKLKILLPWLGKKTENLIRGPYSWPLACLVP